MVKTVVVALLLLILPSSQTEPQKAKPILIVGGYLKAADFLDLDASQKEYFAMGFIDGLFAAPLLNAPYDGKVYVSLQNCIKEMNGPAQAGAIIEKYIREDPEEWNLQLNVIAFTSLLKACHATLN